jgi:hypothetical protein
MKNSSRDQAKTEFKQTSFLPDVEFNPIYPKSHTLLHRCLSMMLSGQTFTHPEFELIAGSWRLSAVIFTLKGLGWDIDSHDISAPSKDCPSRVISRYNLSDKTIADVLGGAN